MFPWLIIRVVLRGEWKRGGGGGGGGAAGGYGDSLGRRWASVSNGWCWAWAATWVRAMGEGPRTYPGGVSKWQWKRMLVTRREERERIKLAREKNLYEMRQRAEVLAAHPELQQPWEKLTIFPPPGITAGQQIASLMRRFHRPQQAEDLWTQRDGPNKGTDPSSCLDTVAGSPETGHGQLQHPAQPSGSSLDAGNENASSRQHGQIHHPSTSQPQSFSARWHMMDTMTPQRKKEASSIGRNMQDYLDSFDTDPLGVAVEIGTRRSKKEVHKDPLGLLMASKVAAKKETPKKKAAKGGRKRRAR